MPLSVEVGVSVAAYSELLDESKSTFFLEFAGLISFALIQRHRNNFSSESKPAVFNLIYTIASF